MKREEGEVVYGERQHTPREPLLLQRALFRSVRCRHFFFWFLAVSDAGLFFFGGVFLGSLTRALRVFLAPGALQNLKVGTPVPNGYQVDYFGLVT